MMSLCFSDITLYHTFTEFIYARSKCNCSCQNNFLSFCVSWNWLSTCLLQLERKIWGSGYTIWESTLMFLILYSCILCTEGGKIEIWNDLKSDTSKSLQVFFSYYINVSSLVDSMERFALRTNVYCPWTIWLYL